MPEPRLASPTVGIVGGGFTGAAVAVHLSRLLGRHAELVVVEPRARIGAGLAYGACASEHRINVPSDRMNVFPDDPTHFTRWLKKTGRFDADREALTADGQHYSRRHDFGEYMASLVEAAAGRVALRHARGEAVGLGRRHGRYEIAIAGGSLACDAVVITASHAAPACPWALDDSLRAHPGFVVDPWRPGAFDAIDPQARVFIAGTGLTMCDAVVALRRRGHRGSVLAVSRRALLPRVHTGFDDAFALENGPTLPVTALGLLHRVRRGVATAEAAGLDWRAALDALRRELPAAWPRLPLHEQQRVVRRLRPWWDVHRFRTAPQVHAQIEDGRVAGWLQVEKGRLHEIRSAGTSGLAVHWSGPDGAAHRSACEVFLNCTGPEADLGRRPSAFFAALLAAGLGRVDPLRLGLDTDATGRLRDRAGALQPLLRAAGPLARAAVGEVTGVPEASRHALAVATDLTASLAGLAPGAPSHPRSVTNETP